MPGNLDFVMNDSTMKRIAIVGFALESNAFAPVTTRQDFLDCGFVMGEKTLEEGHLKPLLDPEGKGFGRVMEDHGPWEPVPILFGTAGAGGPCDHEFFDQVINEITTRLRTEEPLDGVYIIGHGAGTTTKLDDLDGAYFSAIRNTVGPEIPVIATLDLHGNVSDEMVANADILVSFRTNPHIDMVERSAEAAQLMQEMFHGMKPTTSFVRLPLVTAQVTQLTGAGKPYGDLINYGQERINSDVANVSILSGFAFSDSRHNGMAIIVTTRDKQQIADEVTSDLADYAWRDRSRYVPKLISIDHAVELAVRAGSDHTLPAIILADVADNPGGGGRGNTTWLLEALHDADAHNVFFGVFYDPKIVEEATMRGVGTTFRARLNQDEPSEFSCAFEAEAEVMSLTDGRFRGRRGMIEGIPINLGPSCLLKLRGILLAVISIRQQIFSSETFDHFGLVPEEARTFVVKSRGHFRAGFSHLVDDDYVFEVDAPGLATPNLNTLHWRGLPRPVYPMDPDTIWP